MLCGASANAGKLRTSPHCERFRPNARRAYRRRHRLSAVENILDNEVSESEIARGLQQERYRTTVATVRRIPTTLLLIDLFMAYLLWRLDWPWFAPIWFVISNRAARAAVDIGSRMATIDPSRYASCLPHSRRVLFDARYMARGRNCLCLHSSN